jgi:hypothetical protein
VKDMFLELLRSLFPPDVAATPDAHHRWRWSVSIMTLASVTAITVHIAIACGYLTAIHPGFAHASDLQTLKVEWRQAQEAEVETKILETRVKQCTSKEQVRHLYTESLQKLVVHYQRVAGRAYPLPSCADIS